MIPMTLVIDTREQLEYSFDDVIDPVTGEPLRTTRTALIAGDYSLFGHEHAFAIERKSAADAYSTFSSGRARFERELDRAAGFEYFAILVEASMDGLLTPPPHVQHVKPGTVLNSLISWSIERGVFVWFACNREIGRTTVLRLAEKFWRSKHDPARKSARVAPAAPPPPLPI